MVWRLIVICNRFLSGVRSFLSVSGCLLMITRLMSDNMPRAAILEKTGRFYQKFLSFGTKVPVKRDHKFLT